MFDDPNKEQMLNKHMTDEEFERFYDEIFDEFGPKDRQEEHRKEAPARNVRNYANGYGSQPRQSAPRRYQTGGPAAYGGNLDEEQPRAAAPAKEKGIRGLVILACAECLGIVGVVLWWMLRIL